MNRTTRQATRTAVSAQSLHKTYGDTTVLDGVDLSVGEGEVFALLGPNGAGKTTTVKILSTLIPADAGAASVMGHDLRGEAGAVRAVIGVTGQFSAVDNWLTGEENLLLMGRLLHLPPAERRARRPRPLPRGAPAAGRGAPPGGAQTPHPRRAHPAALRRRHLPRRSGPSAAGGHPRRPGAGGPGTERGRHRLAAGRARPPRRRRRRGRPVHPHARPRRRVLRPDRPPLEGARPVTTLTIAAQDSTTMIGRELKHTLRFPLLLIGSILGPVVFLLLFVYILRA